MNCKDSEFWFLLLKNTHFKNMQLAWLNSNFKDYHQQGRQQLKFLHIFSLHYASLTLPHIDQVNYLVSGLGTNFPHYMGFPMVTLSLWFSSFTFQLPWFVQILSSISFLSFSIPTSKTAHGKHWNLSSEYKLQNRW